MKRMTSLVGVMMLAVLPGVVCASDQQAEQAQQQQSGTQSTVQAPDPTALAHRARNPIADAASLPFQYNANFDVGPNKVTRSVLNIQPLLPLNINERWAVIARPVVPVIWQKAPAPGVAGATGLGDTNLQLYVTPRNAGKWIWGVGPAILLPTATDKTLGSGKWALGPAAIVLTIKGRWLYGVLINNVWSFGHGDRPNVTLLTMQPFATYVISRARGWYVTSSPFVTASRTAGGGNASTAAIGGGVGKVFPRGAGRPSSDVSLQGYFNVVTPVAGPTWQLRFVAQILFPKRRA